MTHPEQHTAIQAALESLVEEGFDGMATAMQILFNEAMKIERSQFLRAEPHERTSEREGYANGFKPKSVKSRIGRLDLRIPQVRDTETPFYPRSLERGLRSERALKLAIAEMYVQGVSTHERRDAVSERGVDSAAGERPADGDRRGVGDRSRLHYQHGRRLGLRGLTEEEKRRCLIHPQY